MRKTDGFVTGTRVLLACAIMIAVLSGSSLAAADVPSDCKDVATDKGKITGVLDAGVCSYKGVPYAAPPIGELRFAKPVPHEPWGDTLVADEFSGECLQYPISLFQSSEVKGTEDCLYLNLWHSTEPAEAPRPVMVFIHGGGFIYGSGSWDTYDGARLAKFGDVVVITFNYRLGPFGFLAHPSLGGPDSGTGNYGLYDQVAVLEWVKENAANFGGDPDNVTIFGESAGGMSVGALMVSPVTRDKGLYHRAIIESGPVVLMRMSLDEAYEAGKKVAEKFGCPDPATAAECLRSIDADVIMSAAPPSINFLSSDGESSINYMPITGTEMMPGNPLVMFRDGDFDTSVPVILGSNRDEASYFTASIQLDTEEEFLDKYHETAKAVEDAFGYDFLKDDFLKYYPLDEYENPKYAYRDIFCDMGFTCPTRILASLISNYQEDVYLYHFRQPPQKSGMLGDWGAFHGAELAFVFGNFSFMGIKFSSKENKITASKVIAYWSSFARDGSPQVKGLPEWPRYKSSNSPFIVLASTISTGENLKKDACDYLESLFNEVVGEK